MTRMLTLTTSLGNLREIWDGIWSQSGEGFFVSDRYGLWLYELTGPSPTRRLITDGQMTTPSSDESDICELAPHPANPSLIAYTINSQYSPILVGLIHTENGNLLPLEAVDGWESDAEEVQLEFSPNGRLLAAARNLVQLWDTQTRKSLYTYLGYRDPICWTPDGNTLICSGNGLSSPQPHQIVFHDVTTNTVKTAIEGENYGRRCFSIHLADSFVVVVFSDGSLRWWNLGTLQLRGEVRLDDIEPMDSGWGDTVVISPDRQMLAVCGRDGKKKRVKLLAIPTFNEVARLEPNSGRVRFAPDSRRLAVVNDNTNDESVDIYEISY